MCNYMGLTPSVKCKIWLQEKRTKCVNQWHKLTTLEKMVADDCSFGFCLKINKSFSILETIWLL